MGFTINFEQTFLNRPIGNILKNSFWRVTSPHNRFVLLDGDYNIFGVKNTTSLLSRTRQLISQTRLNRKQQQGRETWFHTHMFLLLAGHIIFVVTNVLSCKSVAKVLKRSLVSSRVKPTSQLGNVKTITICIFSTLPGELDVKIWNGRYTNRAVE